MIPAAIDALRPFVPFSLPREQSISMTPDTVAAAVVFVYWTTIYASMPNMETNPIERARAGISSQRRSNIHVIAVKDANRIAY